MEESRGDRKDNSEKVREELEILRHSLTSNTI